MPERHGVDRTRYVIYFTRLRTFLCGWPNRGQLAPASGLLEYHVTRPMCAPFPSIPSFRIKGQLIARSNSTEVDKSFRGTPCVPRNGMLSIKPATPASKKFADNWIVKIWHYLGEPRCNGDEAACAPVLNGLPKDTHRTEASIGQWNSKYVPNRHLEVPSHKVCSLDKRRGLTPKVWPTLGSAFRVCSSNARRGTAYLWPPAHFQLRPFFPGLNS